MTGIRFGDSGKHAGRRTWRIPRIPRFLPWVAVPIIALGIAPIATAFLQVPDEPSPRSGTAQVAAQGVVAIPGGDLRWQVSEQTAPPPANASQSSSNPGFIIAESGVVLLENVESGEQFRVPSGEAVLTRPESEQVRVALGSDPAAYWELALVDAAASETDATALYSSEPFAGPEARHDLDLLLDALAPGAALTVPGGALPTLAFVLAGVADVATEAGDIVSLGVGEAVALTGPLVVTAGENGAEVAAVYTGPAVPRLGQVAATPAASPRVIEPRDADQDVDASASPVTRDATEQPAAGDPDDDGDGLTATEEAELNTDPALADTDEDGLTDGQEALETGTAPLAPDTDGDGVLDGDEVAQGTNALDGVEGTDDEGAPATDEPPPAGDVPAGTAGDSDGDGLEDTIEFELGTDVADPDTDDDGSLDGDEYYVLQSGTRNPDSDGDGVLDGTEAANGTDPNDPNSF